MPTNTDHLPIVADSHAFAAMEQGEVDRTPPSANPMPSRFPLADEPFVATWENYVREAADHGVIQTLQNKLIQLRFPIAPGISATSGYLVATRAGRWPASNGHTAIRFNAPDSIELTLYQSLAGRIAGLTVPDREDFAALVRALTRRNEPAPVPASMGACLVSGYNNWDRVARLRADWKARNLLVNEGAWDAEFARLKTRPELFQDRFLILSTGPYSGIPAAELGISCASPDHFALTLRREHEFVHLFCRRVWGRLNDPILEEIIADFVGLLAAAGEFQADWMLRFFGLEDPDRPRPGGRLQNYLTGATSSAAEIRKLNEQIVAAARNLETFAADPMVSTAHPNWKLHVLTTLSVLSLQTLAEQPAGRWCRSPDLQAAQKA